MDWRRDCAAVIPCFNEAAQIHRVVGAVQEHLPTVIVVDDGSTDRTAENARIAGAEIVRLAIEFRQRRGLHAAAGAGRRSWVSNGF